MAKNNTYFGTGSGVFKILIFIFIPLVILVIVLLPQFLGNEAIETVIEEVPYQSKFKYSSVLLEGSDCYKPKGQNGSIVKEYRVKYRFGQEISRELVSETIGSTAVDELRIIGTAHKYTGTCAIVQPVRRYRVECYGDYSPEAEAKAKEQAEICNNTPYELPECQNVYYSSVWTSAKTCNQLLPGDY